MKTEFIIKGRLMDICGMIRQSFRLDGLDLVLENCSDYEKARFREKKVSVKASTKSFAFS